MFIKYVRLILLLISISFLNLFAQDTLYYNAKNKPYLSYQLSKIKQIEADEIPQVEVPNETVDNVDYNTLLWVGGITVASGVGVHLYEANSWWREPNTSFHITWDTKYALGIDKLGHFYASGLLSHAFASTVEAANVDVFTSAWIGAAVAFSYEMFVEIEDGFGPNWGFSPGDAIADFFGPAYYVAQHYFPVLQNFQPRVSYYPSEKFLNGETKAIVIDDYEGQTFWLAMRINNLLPKNLSEYWPSWLMLSLGTAARELDGKGGGYREYYLALDFDPDYIPISGRFGQFVKNTLNYLHFPMPGIRITPNFAAFAIIF